MHYVFAKTIIIQIMFEVYYGALNMTDMWWELRKWWPLKVILRCLFFPKIKKRLYLPDLCKGIVQNGLFPPLFWSPINACHSSSSECPIGKSCAVRAPMWVTPLSQAVYADRHIQHGLATPSLWLPLLVETPVKAGREQRRATDGHNAGSGEDANNRDHS